MRRPVAPNDATLSDANDKSLCGAIRRFPHIADIGKIEMPPFMNGKFAAFLKITPFCGPSHSIPAIADRQRRAVELTVSSEKLDAHS